MKNAPVSHHTAAYERVARVLHQALAPRRPTHGDDAQLSHSRVMPLLAKSENGFARAA